MIKEGERSGSVVECLTRDRRAAGSNLTGVTFQENAAVFFGSCLKEFHSVWNCLFNIITFCLKDVGAICFVVPASALVAHFTRLCLKAVTEPNSAEPTKLTECSLFLTY